MAPLVYDFGQLNTGTEYDYIIQIVKDRVRACVSEYISCFIASEMYVLTPYVCSQVNKHSQLCTKSHVIIPAISTALAVSQEFMRDQEVTF